MNIYRDASKYGIVFILTVISTNGIRSRMLQYFNNRICLQLPEEQEYRNILNAPRGLYPAKLFGRGLIDMNDTAYEFQTAILLEKEDMNNFVRSMAEQMNEAYTTRAKKIPTLPKIVTLDLFSQQATLDKVPIGYAIDNKEPYYYDFSYSKFLPILSTDMNEDKMKFVYGIIRVLNDIPNIHLRVVDFANVFKNENNVKCYNNDWDNEIVSIYNEIMMSRQNNRQYYYVFLGIGQIKKVLSTKALSLFNKLLLEINDTDMVNFALIDTYISYKRMQTEVWYQAKVDNSYGIWLGEDVGTQVAINFNNLTLEEKRLYFPYIGFAVKDGKHKIIKYMINQTGDEINEE